MTNSTFSTMFISYSWYILGGRFEAEVAEALWNSKSFKLICRHLVIVHRSQEGRESHNFARKPWRTSQWDCIKDYDAQPSSSRHGLLITRQLDTICLLVAVFLMTAMSQGRDLDG
uniref:Uncharacterized protein n=1 Tax=Nelumbo nucifera TaxID=4432 RepID=A0A822Z0L5_NELNU|nr:TPA_asm: hypothetical protein HUJ06_005658 [Nelumbo nucifera]